MHVVVQQVVVVYGQHLAVLEEYFLNYGVQEAMDQVHVRAIDAIIIKVPAADIMHQK
tara:strand:+ start:1205 stop:1375 length:171 start_codon:yes stop_codon:yes gene_type:complete